MRENLFITSILSDLEKGNTEAVKLSLKHIRDNCKLVHLTPLQKKDIYNCGILKMYGGIGDCSKCSCNVLMNVCAL